MEAIFVLVLLGWWLGMGALGVWLGNRHLDALHPTVIDPDENARAYIMAVAGPPGLIGALMFIAANPLSDKR